ncbi:cytochrome D1 domain-containing protein [Azospirillum sp.]|uniref:cytochrome D1 domain-containing protein n=1 Tax=Azospirillum sp. TaxID=34012 RepID=UPI002D2E030D|nr:cytochrome D1 domain-containing protein [Azospirillum sp.]HYD65177.1 cytochrome D1 domain-containing protein [Azospirillum sp.]
MRNTLFAAALAALLPGAALAMEGPAATYAEHCAACHGGDRLGAIGPALLPDNLGRLKPAEAQKVIAEGRAATQMPAFAGTLTEAQIKDLAGYVLKAPQVDPKWEAVDIAASHVVHKTRAELPAKPVFDADPLNLFTVVEAGDHHVTILDGDRFEPLARFPSRFALHGGVKYSPDGRFAYFASRDGWIAVYDLYSLQTVAEVRAGINTRNIAVSGDGRFVAVGNTLPRTLVLLDARDLSLIKVMPVAAADGRTSRVSAVYTAPMRNSFVVALKDIPEIWEIATNDDAPPVYTGLVHSYEKGQEEGVPAQKGLFALRRTELAEPLDDFFFNPDYSGVIGAARDGASGQVVNLDARRKEASLDLPGMPHLGSGISWMRDGRRVMATQHLKGSTISVIDMGDWKTVKRIDSLGPGFFLRSHENVRTAWADAMLGPKKDTMAILDKDTLEIVRTITPEPGKTAAHVEFTRDGRFALVSVWEQDGALVIYDARTFAEVKRLPMKKPVGKYNVFNKITLSEGTSH